MPLMDLIITLVVVGAILWVVNNYIPMQANVKKILNIVVVGVLILFLLNAFGILGSPSRFRFGRW
ncbi:MAG: Thivi_2564 family membrane protein [Spirochaetia bacterium]